MKVELIPVLEIGYNNQNIEAPKRYPYWENSDIWDKYNSESYKLAGFLDEFIPYLAGSSFYEPKIISEVNLKKIVLDHTEGVRNREYERELSCPLFGGYVLRVNYEDEYFPQCCGDIADIEYWEKLSTGKSSPYEGHPAPLLKFKGKNVILDFTVGEYDEPFEPTPKKNLLKIDRKSLEEAVKEAKLELNTFAQRILKINLDANLNIRNLDGWLIWGTSVY